MQKEVAAIVDSYRSIAAPCEGLFKDKGSRFIAYAFPFDSADELTGLMERIRREHHGARHHCFAYRLGASKDVFRVNDDGEPSSTAGRPILAAIDSAGYSDVLVVVVRYFGGILLGAPGLVRAYRAAAEDALAKAEPVQKLVSESFVLEFAYGEEGAVRSFLKGQQGVVVTGRRFGEGCQLTVQVRLCEKENFLSKLKLINNEKSTRIQCRPVQVAPTGD